MTYQQTEREKSTPHLWSIPPGTKPSKCSAASCRATIYWIKTANGKNMPVDPNVPGGCPPDSPLSKADQSGLGLAHWATCPARDQFRRPK